MSLTNTLAGAAFLFLLLFALFAMGSVGVVEVTVWAALLILWLAFCLVTNVKKSLRERGR